MACTDLNDFASSWVTAPAPVEISYTQAYRESRLTASHLEQVEIFDGLLGDTGRYKRLNSVVMVRLRQLFPRQSAQC